MTERLREKPPHENRKQEVHGSIAEEDVEEVVFEVSAERWKVALNVFYFCLFSLPLSSL